MADQAKTTTTDEPDEVRRPSNGFDRYFAGLRAGLHTQP